MEWKKQPQPYVDIIYEKAEGIAKISINRPQRKNAARPDTMFEMKDALMDAWFDDEIGTAIITGVGDAFCAGGDVSTRDADKGGYVAVREKVGHGVGIIVQRVIREIPKVVIAMVNGVAVGGGNVLTTICDLTVASDKATFGQIGPRFGSYDPAFGICYLARLVGEKKAREIWFTCRRYTAQQALEMGLVNAVVPHEKLEEETVKLCKEIMSLSLIAVRNLKFSINAETSYLDGIAVLTHPMLSDYYRSEEGREGAKAFLEKRKPEYNKFWKYLH